jgi:hypothetical protein
MKKMIFVCFFLFSLTAQSQRPILEQQQNKETFFKRIFVRTKIVHDTVVLHDTVVKIQIETRSMIVFRDTCISKQPIDTVKPVPIPAPETYACLYIDKLSSRLGNAAEEEKLINYTIQTGFNAWAEYTLSSIVGNETKEAQLRSLHTRARAKGVKYIESVSSGSPSSVSDRIAFNSRCTKPEEKFDVMNIEYESWNQTDLMAASVINTSRLLYQSEEAKMAGLKAVQYWGWLKKQPFIQTPFITGLIESTDWLPHHYYQTSPSASYHAQELDSLNAISKRLGIIYKYRPIFSAEPEFSQSLLKQITAYQLFLNWKKTFDSKNYSNLKCDGFYMFDFSYLEQAIPYKNSASMTTARRLSMLSDTFINQTTPEHIKMSKDE